MIEWKILQEMCPVQAELDDLGEKTDQISFRIDLKRLIKENLFRKECDVSLRHGGKFGRIPESVEDLGADMYGNGFLLVKDKHTIARGQVQANIDWESDNDIRIQTIYVTFPSDQYAKAKTCLLGK